MILHLGVIDLPYARAPSARQRRRGSGGTQTTGDVAGWLEDRYHVMEVFFETHRDEIGGYLAEAYAGALETALMGGAAPGRMDPSSAAMTRIEDRFREFLSLREIEKMGIPGVPTGAALRGVNHRMKHPYARRAARPSFVDTGLYQSSFRAWMD